VVRSGFLFSLRARLSGDRSRLRSGRYTLKEGMSYAAALTALTTAPKAVPTVNITIPEGPSRREEAPKLRAAGVKGSYLAATRRSSKLDPRDYGAPRSTRSLEGFLYPDTYQLRRSDVTARRLVSRQVEAFRTNFAKVSMARAKRRNLSRYDVLIIASMIEREALVPRDRRLIAAVIYNRLKEGMPLGIDATLRYGLNIPPTESIRQSQLESDSPYNTRNHAGLPPTPIANPGLASMQAAAHPANVDYLYFVRKPDKKHHFFTASFEAFQNYANTHGYGGP
ncbi:MAG: endolytic transglycosylase MltG, partial [Gaiellaceae bacterium]